MRHRASGWRRAWQYLEILCCLWLCGSTVWALDLSSDFKSQPLSAESAIYADKSGRLQAADVVNRPFQLTTTQNLGFFNGSYWLRFHVNNPALHDRSLILELNYPVLDHVFLYRVLPGGAPVLIGRAGDNEPWSSRSLSIRTLAFPLVASAGSHTEFLMQIRSTSNIVLPLTLYEQNTFWQAYAQRELRQGLLYGGIAVLIFYSLFVFIFSHERIFGLYVIHQIPIVAYLLCVDGFLYQIMPRAEIQNFTVIFFLILSNLIGPIFVSEYLHLRESSPRLFQIVKACIVIAVLEMLLLIGGALQVASQFALIVSAVLLVLFPLLGYFRVRAGDMAARYYVLAWSAFFLMGIVTALAVLGIINYDEKLFDGMKIAVFLTSVVMTIGLGVRVRTLKTDGAEVERRIIMAQAQAKAKSDFLAIMSHEIRTPMNGVLGMIELLKATGLSQEQQRIAQTIESSGDTLLSVINDILDYSKIESGNMVLDAQEFDLQHVIADSMSLFKAKLFRKGIKLLCSVSPRTPTRVIGDPMRLRQVLVNLVSNAVKFTERGRIDLIVSGVAFGEVVRLEVAVKDTGIGIRAEDLDKIFESFSQSGKPNVSSDEGTGLGLAICRSICRLMHGDIYVESHLYQGSTFSFNVQMGLPTVATPGFVWPTGLARRMLLVDDDVEYLEMMGREATLPELQIETASSGTEALQKVRDADARQESFQLVVSSLQLEDMNGLSLRQRFVEQNLGTVPDLVVMTQPYWQPNPGILQQVGGAGAVERPVMAHELHESLVHLLSRDVPAEGGKITPLSMVRPIKVLVAEDNRTNQLVLVGMLKRLGINPDVVDDGDKAVARFRQEVPPYDMVLMDCEMPVCDGYQATRRIRDYERREGRRRVPVIAVTAHVTRPHIDGCYAAGMDDHLAKPINHHHLRTKLEHWIVS